MCLDIPYVIRNNMVQFTVTLIYTIKNRQKTTYFNLLIKFTNVYTDLLCNTLWYFIKIKYHVCAVTWANYCRTYFPNLKSTNIVLRRCADQSERRAIDYHANEKLQALEILQ